MKPTYYLTAYGIALKHGFKGTEEEWLISLTAFYLAQKAGFTGTVDEWLKVLNDPVPRFSIGEVKTLEGGSEATVSITGDKENPILNFGIPRGLGMEDALPLVGGKMKGAVDMDSHGIHNLPEPKAEGDAVNQKYADAIKKIAQDAGTAAQNAQSTANNAKTAADKAATAAGKALTAAVYKTNATITLSANGWAEKEQTVNVPGVTTDEDCDVLITPGNVGYLSYLDCVVRGKEQGDGTVTFICEDVPEEDVSANIMILSKGVKS